MILITPDQLRAMMPRIGSRADVYAQPLNEAMQDFEINTALREAAFLAQCAHESGEFYYTHELASGEAYEGRKDLGNTEPGDGVRFKGRGPIQITGRRNYAAASLAIYGDNSLLIKPELLEQPHDGCLASAWFWSSRDLNTLADDEDFNTITHRINGGYNGINERQAYYRLAKKVLGV
jgi:putative chitinase